MTNFKEEYANLKRLCSCNDHDVYVYANSLSYADHFDIIVYKDVTTLPDLGITVEVPEKGKIVAAISAGYYALAKKWGIHTAFVESNSPYPDRTALEKKQTDDSFYDAAEDLDERTVIESRMILFPIRYYVYGHLYGPIWEMYKKGEHNICGEKLPSKLLEGDMLPRPIFVAIFEDNQEMVSCSEMAFRIHEMQEKHLLCKTSGWCANDPGRNFNGLLTAQTIENFCLGLYRQAYNHARQRGLIIAGSEIKVGFSDPLQENTAKLCGSLLTPDVADYWDATTWEPGTTAERYDKKDLYWAFSGMTIDNGITVGSSQRYEEIYEKLFDRQWPNNKKEEQRWF